MARNRVQEVIKDVESKIEEAYGIKIETYKRPDGWWSFRINGTESHYRSSNEAGLGRTIKTLLFGLPTGTITLQAMKANGGGGQIGNEKTMVVDEKASWQTLGTQQERISAFLSRGKLARKDDSNNG